jgi:hypothetical protein
LEGDFAPFEKSVFLAGFRAVGNDDTNAGHDRELKIRN